jgi:translation initiation factor IF-2
MAEEKMIRLGQASRKLNVGHNTILDFLAKKGFAVENNPNAKLSPEQYAMLAKEYASSASEKIEASGLTIGTKHNENLTIQNEPVAHKRKAEEEDNVLIKNLGSKEIKAKEEVKQPEKVEREKPKLEGIKVVGKIDLEKKEAPPVPAPKEKEEVAPKKPEPVAEVEKPQVPELELIKAKANRLQGLKVVDKIELPAEKEKKPAPTAESKEDARKKRPRKRIPSQGNETKRRPTQNGHRCRAATRSTACTKG